MKSKFLVALTVLLMSPLAQANKCLYSIKKDSEKITWTGFKFTSKTAVSGTFDKVTFSQKKSSSLEELLQSISFKIDSSSINSGNPARDATLTQSILGFLKVPDQISGNFKSVEGSNVTTALTLNESFEQVFAFTAQDGKITLKGQIDLLANSMKKSYDQLHSACEEKHKGEDGISKTWSTVDIKVEADYEEKCSKGLIESIKDWFS